MTRPLPLDRAARPLECGDPAPLSLRPGRRSRGSRDLTARSSSASRRRTKGFLAVNRCQASPAESSLGSTELTEVRRPKRRQVPALHILLASHRHLARKLDPLEQKYDHQFAVVFDAIRQLMNPDPPPRKPIGFMRKE